jgi:hypothetical protein
MHRLDDESTCGSTPFTIRANSGKNDPSKSAEARTQVKAKIVVISEPGGPG